MQFSFETEKKENSQILLKITVDKSEVDKQYQTIIADAQKNAIINGFRKGKVPLSVLEMKYKEGFLMESANKLVDETYKEVIEKLEKKPLGFSYPKLDETFKLPELGKDFSFSLVYDTYPDIQFGSYKGLETVKDEVTISEEDIKNEISRYLKDFSTIEVKEGAIADGDIAFVHIKVLENGSEIYQKDGEYIHVGKDYDFYKISKDITGMKKEDTKTFTKKFGKGEIESLAGKSFEITVTIKEVKREVTPELNEDLVKQIDENITTVEDFRKKVKDDLEKYAESIVKNKGLEKIVKEIIETFQGDIPQSMIDEQLKVYFNDFLQRFRNDEKRALKALESEGLTRETYLEKFKDQALVEIKRALILQEIVKMEKITVTEDEIKAHIEPYAKYYRMKPEDLFTSFKNSGNLRGFENEVEIKKALDFLYDNAKHKKGKKFTLDELIKKSEEEKTEK